MSKGFGRATRGTFRHALGRRRVRVAVEVGGHDFVQRVRDRLLQVYLAVGDGCRSLCRLPLATLLRNGRRWRDSSASVEG